MTTNINQNSFTESLARRGGYIDIRNMSPTLRHELQHAGITDEDLREIAGRDSVIRGKEEFANLFRRIDRVDGTADSKVTTHDDAGGLTRAGRVYDAIRTEVDNNRARAAREGGMRFQGDATLDRVMDGRQLLAQGSQGESVRKVQQALIDMGFGIPSNGANGNYDIETTRAVRRFQREMGLKVDGVVGQETLGALAASAPPPGHRLERSADYEKLYKDGRLDIAIAIGYDEDGNHLREQRQILSGLRRDGWQPLNYDSLPAEERRRYGLTADRYDPNALYFTKQIQDPQSGQPVDAVIRMVTPGTDGGRARRSFEQAMEQDEVVYYSGHARYGIGPDFDASNRGDGNFVIDPAGNRRGETPPAGLRASVNGRASDLSRLRNRPEYQVLVFNGCTTEDYLPNLRNSRLFGRDDQNTDIVTTTMVTSTATGGPHALRFLQGITSRENNNSMYGAMSGIESAELRPYDPNGARRARNTFTESGFLSNPGNRVVRYPNP